MRERTLGHLLASVTIAIWGTTFISTKIMLRSLSPLAILFYRFLLAYLVLLAVLPKGLRPRNLREELNFFLLGLTGVALYFFLENLALQHTLASNVGLIISTAPIMTAGIAHYATGDERIAPGSFLGCAISMIGVALLVLGGRFSLRISPVGDLLALAAAGVWAVYSVILKRTGGDHHPILVTRKTFFYGIVSASFLLLALRPDMRPAAGAGPALLVHLAFLSVAASSLGFVMWGRAVRLIGVVSTSNYIYLVPLITALAARVVLGEKLGALMVLGGFLILCGVYIAEKNTGPGRAASRSLDGQA